MSNAVENRICCIDMVIIEGSVLFNGIRASLADISLALGKFRRFIVHFRAFLRRAIIYKKSLSLYGLTSLSYLRNMSNVWYYSTFNMFVIVGSGLQLMFHQTDEDDKN